MIPATFEYHAPASLKEALTLLRRYPGEAKLLAGGHSLLPMMKLRLAQPSHIVDLGRVSDLAYIRETAEGGLSIGPMTTYRMLHTSELVTRRAPVLAEAAAQIADLQVRNKGTIGGSLAHADPAADLPAVMLALEGVFSTSGAGRARAIPAARFFQGLFTTALKDGEVITEIAIPGLPARTGGAYAKFANKASHFAIVGVAALVTLDESGRCARARIGVTGAGDHATRARSAERFLTGRELTDALIGQAAIRATEGIESMSDLHASAEYREHLTEVFARRALTEAAARARRQGGR